MKKSPSFTKERLILSVRLVLAVMGNWLNNKVPKWLLILAVLVFGYLGSRSVIFIHEIGGYFVPSIIAIWNGTPDWPFIVATWSLALLFIAACMQHKSVAFEAALQLYRRFGIKWVP